MSQVVSVRIPDHQKKLLKELGYTMKDVTNYFFKDHNNPKKELQVKQANLEQEIKELTELITDSELKKISLEKQLEEISNKIELFDDAYSVDSNEITDEVEYVFKEYNKTRNNHKGYDFGLYLNSHYQNIKGRCDYLNVNVEDFINLVEEKINESDII